MTATDPTGLSPASRRSVQLSSSDQSAWIVRDEVDGGWVLQIGGVEQSHVDLADPTRLVHEYLRRMGKVLAQGWPAGAPSAIAPAGGRARTPGRHAPAR